LNIVDLGNSIDYKNDGAKLPARRGFSAYALESDVHKSSIGNLQFSIFAAGGFGLRRNFRDNILNDCIRLQVIWLGGISGDMISKKF
jgi:hypothetical protein